MLTIQKSIRDREAFYRLSGRLDAVSAPELTRELRETLPGVDRLTLDLEETEYIASAGLRVLLSARRALGRQGSVKLLHVSDSVLEVLETTGLAAALEID